MSWLEKGLNFDRWILIPVLALSFFGLVMVYSTSSILAMDKYHDPYFFLKRHLLYLSLGLILLLVLMHLDHHRFRFFGGLLVFSSVILLILVYFFPPIRGAHRWLRLGPFQFQPSELAKLSMVIYLAHSLAKREKKLSGFWSGVLPYLLTIGLISGLVFFERDFGGALSIVVLGFCLLYVAGIRLWYLLVSLLGGSTLGLCLLSLKDYQWERWFSFLEPWQYAQDEAFQLIQSFLAFGSGGLFGVGLGMSHQKLFYLPDAHTDFIFSIIAEECGWVAIIGIILLYGIFLTRGVWVSFRAPSAYSQYLAMGLTLMIAMPALINMAVVTGLLPTKGLVLPFLSYGGSSLLISLSASGILLNISAKRYQG